MKNWTTPNILKLLNLGDVPFEVHPESAFEEIFLRNSVAGDIAVIALNDLTYGMLEKGSLGLAGRHVIFISPEPVTITDEFQDIVVLDLKRLTVQEVRKHVRLITSLRTPAIAMPAFEIPGHLPAVTAEMNLSDVNILDLLSHNHRENQLIDIEFVLQKGASAKNVRGICNIHSVRDQYVVLQDIRPASILQTLKEGTDINAFLLYQGIKYRTSTTVKMVSDDIIHALIPPKVLGVASRRHYRVTPSARQDIEFCLLVPNEPTTMLKVTDISESGVGILIDRQVLSGSSYGFSMRLPAPLSTVIGFGHVRNERKLDSKYRYGVYLNVHQKDSINISQYIIRRDQEIIRSIRENRFHV